MPVLESSIDTASPEFAENRDAYFRLLDDLNGRLGGARAAGGEAAVKRHHDRGKLLARERVQRLIDRGTTFLELSPLAANGMYEDEAASAGIVTGIGLISGQECVVIA